MGNNLTKNISSTEVPSVESEAFGDWVAAEGNAEKFFDGLEDAK